MSATPTPEWHGLPVHLDAFEGPLDLLLYLIKREEVSIYDIPIARVTEQYLEYIGALSAFDLDRAGEYLVLAATLLDIKARMLLPKPPRMAPADELAEVEDGEDPREALVRQLEAYQQFREAARDLKQREEAARGVHPRGWYPETPDIPAPLARVSLEDLMAAFREVLKEEASWREVPREEVPLREKIREINWSLQRHPEGMRFRELFSRRASRLEVVVTFLALLELIRQRRAVAEQSENFGEIVIRRAMVAPALPAAPKAGED